MSLLILKQSAQHTFSSIKQVKCKPKSPSCYIQTLVSDNNLWEENLGIKKYALYHILRLCHLVILLSRMVCKSWCELSQAMFVNKSFLQTPKGLWTISPQSDDCCVPSPSFMGTHTSSLIYIGKWRLYLDQKLCFNHSGITAGFWEARYECQQAAMKGALCFWKASFHPGSPRRYNVSFHVLCIWQNKTRVYFPLGRGPADTEEREKQLSQYLFITSHWRGRTKGW